MARQLTEKQYAVISDTAKLLKMAADIVSNRTMWDLENNTLAENAYDVARGMKRYAEAHACHKR